MKDGIAKFLENFKHSLKQNIKIIFQNLYFLLPLLIFILFYLVIDFNNSKKEAKFENERVLVSLDDIDYALGDSTIINKFLAQKRDEVYLDELPIKIDKRIPPKFQLLAFQEPGDLYPFDTVVVKVSFQKNFFLTYNPKDSLEYAAVFDDEGILIQEKSINETNLERFSSIPLTSIMLIAFILVYLFRRKNILSDLSTLSYSLLGVSIYYVVNLLFGYNLLLETLGVGFILVGFWFLNKFFPNKGIYDYVAPLLILIVLIVSMEFYLTSSLAYLYYGINLTGMIFFLKGVSTKENFKLSKQPSYLAKKILPMIPFLIILLFYAHMSDLRHRENPDDKYAPGLTQLIDGVDRIAFNEGQMGEGYRLWQDTLATGARFAVATIIIFIGIFFGLFVGAIPTQKSLFGGVITFTNNLQAIVMIALIFLVFGTNEVAKMALVILGVFPTMALDAKQRAEAVPKEYITKAQTLDASILEQIILVVNREVFPRALDTLRINFKAILAYILIAEALITNSEWGGIGYRVFRFRKQSDGAGIIIYVLWMYLISTILDKLVQIYLNKKYHWIDK